MKPIKCCATCIHYWNCKYKNCRSNNWEHWESEVENFFNDWTDCINEENNPYPIIINENGSIKE